MDGELLLYLDVADAIGECRDDGLVRHLGDLEANVVEPLDVLLEGLPLGIFLCLYFQKVKLVLRITRRIVNLSCT